MMLNSFAVSLDQQRRIISTLDAVSVNYDGIMTEKLFACTITSRKKYSSLYTFRHELYNFLAEINYKHAVKGYMEFHGQKGKQDKVHLHAVLYMGNPPKGNKKNSFNFHISKMDTPHVWDAYCKKEIMYTLERHHDIQTGIFNYHNKVRVLFGDSVQREQNA